MATAILAKPTAISAGHRPVAILKHGKPSFYCAPAELYVAMLDAIEDFELANIVRSREDEDAVDINWEQVTLTT